MLLTFLSVCTCFWFKCRIERQKIVGTTSLGSWALGFSGNTRETSTILQVSRQLWYFTSDFSSLLSYFWDFQGKS